jgi:hypothetical protein
MPQRQVRFEPVKIALASMIGTQFQFPFDSPGFHYGEQDDPFPQTFPFE